MSVPGDTVAAIATASGKGALAMIRLSGQGAFTICGACIAQRKRFDASKHREVGLYTIVQPHSRAFIDTICVVKYQQPVSYTGEHMVEITCHGGELIPIMVLDCLLQAGARQAEPGEFTRRAMTAGKMDVLRAEAILAMIESTREEEHARAVAFYNGSAQKKLAELEEELSRLSAEIEAGIETEHEGISDVQHVTEKIANICVYLEGQLRQWEQHGDEAMSVVIAGVVNAGKSTLFNLLAGADRALVDARPGTTRDYVTERITIHGCRIAITDTAGFGRDTHAIDRASTALSWQQINSADRVIWVSPLDRNELTKEEQLLIQQLHTERMLILLSKSDKQRSTMRYKIATDGHFAHHATNLLDSEQRQKTREWVFENIHNRSTPATSNTALIINRRQEKIVQELLLEAQTVLLDKNAGLDVVAEGIRRMLASLQGLYAGGNNEETLKRVLSSFCVGK